jgi:hypothetical protein
MNQPLDILTKTKHSSFHSPPIFVNSIIRPLAASKDNLLFLSLGQLSKFQPSPTPRRPLILAMIQFENDNIRHDTYSIRTYHMGNGPRLSSTAHLDSDPIKYCVINTALLGACLGCRPHALTRSDCWFWGQDLLYCQQPLTLKSTWTLFCCD